MIGKVIGEFKFISTHTCKMFFSRTEAQDVYLVSKVSILVFCCLVWILALPVRGTKSFSCVSWSVALAIQQHGRAKLGQSIET